MSLKDWPDRTKKVKKAEPPAGVKGKLKLEGGVKGGVKVKAEQKDQAETDSNLGRLQTSSSLLKKFKIDHGSVIVKAEQKDPAKTDTNLGRLQTSSSKKFKTDIGSVIVKAEQKDPAKTDSNLGRLQTSSSKKFKTDNGSVIVKAEQKDPAKTDSNLGRLQTSSSSTPKPTAQKAATTCKFTTSNPGRRPCPVCGKLLSGKYIPAHLLEIHGTVKSKQFPNCWPD